MARHGAKSAEPMNSTSPRFACVARSSPQYFYPATHLLVQIDPLERLSWLGRISAKSTRFGALEHTALSSSYEVATSMALGILEPTHGGHVPGTVNVYEEAQRNAELLESGRHLKRTQDGKKILVPQPTDDPNDPLVRYAALYKACAIF